MDHNDLGAYERRRARDRAQERADDRRGRQIAELEAELRLPLTPARRRDVRAMLELARKLA